MGKAKVLSFTQLFRRTILFEKKLFVKLKNLDSSACFNLNYHAAKQYPKLVGFIKSCDQYPHKFNFDHF